MKIYVTRHGQTKWNKVERLQGWMDSELTEEGEEGARKLAKDYAHIDFDIAFSSDLNRAVKTAQILLKGKDTELIKVKELRELGLGAWEGQLLQDLKESSLSKALELYFSKPHEHQMEGAENFHDLMNRIDSFFKHYIFNKEYENVLIVSHGVTINAIFNYIENIAVKNFWREKIVDSSKYSVIYCRGRELSIEEKASTVKGKSY